MSQLTNRGDMAAFAESFIREDFFMQQARANGVEVGAQDPTPAVGGFLQFIAANVGATSIVEVGTGSGVSGLWLFQGAPKDAVLTSIDTEREHATTAREIFEESGINQQRFRLISGHIIDIIAKLADNNYDLVVVRTAPDLIDIVQEAHRMLKPGGTLVIDNALGGGKVADPTQRDFDSVSRRDAIRAIKEDSRWVASVIPLGGGILVATKGR